MAISLNSVNNTVSNHETRIKTLESRSTAPAMFVVSGTYASTTNIVGNGTRTKSYGTAFCSFSGGNFTIQPGTYLLEFGHHQYGNTESNSSKWNFYWRTSAGTVIEDFGQYWVGDWGCTGTYCVGIFTVSAATTYQLYVTHSGGAGSITGRQHIKLTKLSLRKFREVISWLFR